MKSYNHLNLQQKMLKVRKKIPALLKRHYSDEVDYDFVKLDDINKHLTPALNKYGINFTILREDAACIENGRKVFLTKTETGWLYEADLTVQWVNADRPEEQETAVIHLIGTNEMPDKAKGTALTYGMKYYLFNRFNIDQGADEDPDYRAAAGDTAGRTKQNPTKETDAEKSSARTDGNKATLETETEQAAQELIQRRNRKEGRAKKTDAQTASDKIPAADIAEGAQVSGRVGKPEKTEKPEKADLVSAKQSDGVKKEIISEIPDADARKVEPVSAAAKQESASIPTDGGAASGESEICDNFVQGSFVEETGNEETEQEDDVEFTKVSEPTPFDEVEDDPFLQELQADIERQEKQEKHEAETDEPHMTVEEAKKVVCTFGIHMDKTYGEVLEDVGRGRRTLEWAATRFKGTDEAQKEAARILLAEFDAIHGKQAA